MSSEQQAQETKAYKRLIKKLTKENLWIYVLRLLQERPMYGYEIRQKIQENFDFSPARVSCYVVLYKMKSEKLVDESWEESPMGRPDRKYYHATELGKKQMLNAKEFLEKLLTDVFSVKVQGNSKS
ncbi:PadR family transcriptional regulator [Candidatus Borrarchaeum sp.]|uniref:PadR family transcriptional regulator n=1 Tax=Candidatus Borrarchaeum sp. TaxID=2846742 RepID=UPI0025805431|nr:PadR family transcriptional regulator [Candidatus Borrarchaeum sp.]